MVILGKKKMNHYINTPIENETIEKLVSGEYYFHKMYRSEDSYFYAASKSKVINSDIEYLIVLPVITSVE